MSLGLPLALALCACVSKGDTVIEVPPQQASAGASQAGASGQGPAPAGGASGAAGVAGSGGLGDGGQGGSSGHDAGAGQGGSVAGAGGVVGAQGGAGSSGGAGAQAGAMQGGAAGAPPSCQSGCGPALVTIGPTLSIDGVEVTRGHYRVFSDSVAPAQLAHPACEGLGSYAPDEGCLDGAPGGDGDPAVCVDWCGAHAYCVWAGKRLCRSPDGGPVPYEKYDDPKSSEWTAACSSGKASAMTGGVCEWEDGCLDDTAPNGSCRCRDGCATSKAQNRRYFSSTTGFRCCAPLSIRPAGCSMGSTGRR